MHGATDQTETLQSGPPGIVRLTEGLGRTRVVAALFCRADSVYKTMPGVDTWDAERDAMTYTDTHPVVAHPPCTRWSMINGVVLSRYPHKAEEFAWGNDGGTFRFAVDTVRRVGGVIEHPAGSRAFGHHGLPRIGRGPDKHGGWSCELRQVDFGHRAVKRTWLYIVGAGPDDLPPLPAPREATALVVRMPECRAVEVMGKAEREHTPPAFAFWLVELARRCRVRPNVYSGGCDPQRGGEVGIMLERDLRAVMRGAP